MKNLGGRPPYEPTEKDRKFVEAMVACGFRREAIATVVGVSHVTLKKHFDEVLRKAKIQADAKVAGTLFQMATSGQHVAATIFWMKTQLHWKEQPSEHRFVTQDGRDRPFLLADADRLIADADASDETATG
jgi:hypothetical protein